MVIKSDEELSKNCLRYIHPTGTGKSGLLICGEAPGREELIKGIPFIGRAGQLLDKMLDFIGLRREDVYITNAVKVWPMANRKPTPEEIDSWRPILIKEIEDLCPKAILAVGSSATSAILNEDNPITKIRGNLRELVINGHSYKVIPTFHPSYLLRNRGNVDMNNKVKEDLKLAHSLL